MNSLPLLIARRYLVGARTEKNISTMILICFLGIFIGSFALALVASIMNGFEKATHQQLRNIHAQIIMRSSGNELNSDAISTVLASEFPEIKSFSPSAYKQIMLQKPESHDVTNAVIFKAVNPEQEQKTSSIEDKIVGNTKALPILLTGNQIIIGKKLAESLDVAAGDSVDILYITQNNVKNRKITLDKKEVKISGIFSTGIEEFDTNLVIGSFPLMNTLFDHSEASQFSIELNPETSESATIEKLKNRFKLDVFSWKELYPALVSALKLEKYAMFFILTLITIVACMNIISLIFMQIIQKRTDIAILQSMGMTRRSIMSLFMFMGIGLTALATISGLLAAYGIGLLLKKYPFITLPDTYYVSYLPIQMEWYIFFAIFMLIMIISSITTWIPARNSNSIEAAHILRFEG